MRSPEDVAMDVFGATRQYRADIIRADRRALLDEVRKAFEEWSKGGWFEGVEDEWYDEFVKTLDALLEEK